MFCRHLQTWSLCQIHLLVPYIDNTPSYLLGKSTKLHVSGVELSTNNKICQILFTFLTKPIEQIFLAVNQKVSPVMEKAITSRPENLGSIPQRYKFPNTLIRLLLMILAMKLYIWRILIILYLATINLLIFRQICSFFIYITLSI